MGFGLRDGDWLDPPEEPPYGGTCAECGTFEPCPCGCGWGQCGNDRGEMYDGAADGCEDGSYRNGCGPEDPEPDYDPCDLWEPACSGR